MERYNRLLPKEQWPALAGPKQLPEEEKLKLLVSEPWLFRWPK